MKMYVLTLLSFFSFAASAQTSDDASRELQNLIYYPHAGVFNLNLRYNFALSEKGQNYDQNGTQTSSSTSSFDEIVPTLIYGFSDHFRMSLGVNEYLDGQTSTSNNNSGVQSSTSATGLSNPTLAATYRFSDGSNYAIAEAIIAFTPSFTTKNASVSGNNNQPYQVGNEGGPSQFAVEVPHFWETAPGEFEVLPEIIFNSSYTAYGVSPQTTTNYNSDILAEVSIFYRYHFNPQWFLQGQLEYEFPYTYQTQSQADGAAQYQRTVNNLIQPTVRVGWVPKQNLALDWYLNYGSSHTDATPSSGNASSSASQQLEMSLMARFVF